MPQSNISNDNTPEYLEKIRSTIAERLRTLPFAPSVQMQDVPRNGLGSTEEDDDILADMDADENMDFRMTELERDRQIVNDAEFYDSDAEDEKDEHLATRPQEAEALDEEMADTEDRESGEEENKETAQPEPLAVNGDSEGRKNSRSGSIVVHTSETSAVILDQSNAEDSLALPGTGNTAILRRSPEREETSAGEDATEATDTAMDDGTEAPTTAGTAEAAETADAQSPSATPAPVAE